MHSKVITLIALISSLLSFAQQTNNTPLSNYGIGDLVTGVQANYMAIGGNTISYYDSTQLNFYNPASYSSLLHGQPVFSTGINTRLSRFSSAGKSEFDKYFLINHFAFGLAFGKHLGFAAGIRPYSTRGYSFAETQVVGSDSISHKYKGTGSTNETFLGAAVNIVKNKKIELSVGLNLGYIFGSVYNTRYSHIIASDSTSGINEQETKLMAIHYRAGLNFSYHLSDKHSLRFSAIFDPSQDLFGYGLTRNLSAIDVTNINSYVLLTSTGYVAGHTKSAETIGFGFNYQIKFNGLTKKNAIRASQLSILGSFEQTNWKTFSSTLAQVYTPSSMNATNKYTLAFIYHPEIHINEKSTHGSLFMKTNYKIGFSASTLPIQINQATIHDQSINFGLGIPFTAQKSLSSVQVGFSIGNRKANDASILKENYYQISLGFAFAPAHFEHWFVKRKLD